MANRYWVGGSGTWDTTSTTHWSTTSGGASGASVPTSSDDVFFDQNSTYTVSIGDNVYFTVVNCKNFTVSSGTVTFDAVNSSTGNMIYVWGTSFSINANTSFTAPATTVNNMGTLVFICVTDGQVTEVTTNGAILNKWIISVSNNTASSNTTLKLMDNLTVTTNGPSDFYNSMSFDGTSYSGSSKLDLNGNTLTLDNGCFYATERYSIAFGTGGKIILGATGFTNDWIWNTISGTLISITGTGTISYVGGYSTTGDTGKGKMFYGGGTNYTGVTLDVSARSGNGNAILSITGVGQNTKFSGLTSNTSNANVKINIESGATIYLSGDSSCRLGTGNNIITLAAANTSTSPYEFYIKKTQGTVTAQKLSVANCNVSGGAVFTSEYTYSYDRNTTKGWVFSETMFPALIQI